MELVSSGRNPILILSHMITQIYLFYVQNTLYVFVFITQHFTLSFRLLKSFFEFLPLSSIIVEETYFFRAVITAVKNGNNLPRKKGANPDCIQYDT